MHDSFRGIGDYLYWRGDTNWNNSWFPPLPLSKLQIDDKAIRFSNLGSAQHIPIASIVVIRKHLRPIRYFNFIAMDGEQGSKLTFMPIFDKLFTEMVKQQFADINIQSMDGWWHSTENEDRKSYDLPERPTG